MGSEATFSAQFRKDLKTAYGEDIAVHLIVDAPRSKKKPFDVFCCLNALAIAIEFKYVKAGGFSLDKVTPHQLDYLSAWWDAGGDAFIVVLFEKEKIAMSIRADTFKKLKYEHAKNGKTKTVKLEDLEHYRNQGFSTIQFMTRKKYKEDGTRWSVEDMLGEG